MLHRVRSSATRAARSALGFGAQRVASNEWLTSVVYDLMNETNFTGLSEHEEMLSDRVRVDAYHRGIHANIHPGDVVVDLGTGSGLLACMASRAGASKVYAIEHGEIIDLAREIAAHNGCDNIEFVRTNSREFTPPEPVDVILHEQMGDELFNENMVENVLDLRDRALRPGGRVLPSAFRLFVEPVTFAPEHRVRRLWNIDLPDALDLSATERGYDVGEVGQSVVEGANGSLSVNAAGLRLDSTVSDARGRYRFRGVAHDVGLALLASGDWIVSQPSSIKPLRPNEVRTLNLEVELAGSIRAIPIDSDGVGLWFDAKHERGTTWEMNHQFTGEVTFSGVETGRWTLRVRRPTVGGEGVLRTVECVVRAGETTTAEL